MRGAVASTTSAQALSRPGLTWVIVFVFTCLLVSGSRPGMTQEPPLTGASFRSVDLFVESGTEPMAAYQLTFAATKGAVKIVGIEGGEHPAFAQPPFYDPEAMQGERAVLAAFNTAPASQLPKGRIRVATIHIETQGTEAPAYFVQVSAAANASGSRIDVATSLSERKKP